MSCCGPNVKVTDPQNLLKNLRNFDKTDVYLGLNDSKMVYKTKKAEWESK